MTDTPPPAPQPSSTAGASVPAGEPAKKKWGKGRIAGAIGGGCCSVILLVFIIMIIVSLVTGGGGDPEATTSPETATEAEATPEETQEATEEEATTEAPSEEATTEPEATEEATTEEPAEADDPEAWADAVEEAALMGSADWQELCGGDDSLGICWITDVSSTNVGTLDVTLQLTGSDAEAKDLAEGAANSIFSTAGFEHEDLQWVVVYGADGVVIDQKKRSDYPYLT